MSTEDKIFIARAALWLSTVVAGLLIGAFIAC